LRTLLSDGAMRKQFSLTVLSVSILLFTTGTFGQAGQSLPERSRPDQLPISGRISSGTVRSGESTVPVTGSGSVNTLSNSIQVQGAFQGSVPTGTLSKDQLPLSLDEAIRRALAYNLGMIGAEQSDREARSQRLRALAELLPDVNGIVTASAEQVSLATFGFSSSTIPGVPFRQTVIGPFNFFAAGATMTQSLMDLTAIRNFRSSKETARATRFDVRDSKDMVILGVGGSYLQVMATGARVDSARAQVETGRALYEQAVDRNRAGLNARIDVDRSQVELQTQQLRVISLETDLANQKLLLGRLIGLPLGQTFTLTTPLEYRPTSVVLQDALNEAFESRSDLQAAAARVRAAEHAKKAAEAEKTPALTVGGTYGVAGLNPAQSHGTFAITGGAQFAIWRSGRIQADIAQADAVLAQRRAEYEDTYGRVDFDVRSAFLALTAAIEQMKVAESNRSLSQRTLEQARDRFAAGVTDTIEVVQAQESVAVAEQDYISSLFADHLAQLSLARAKGNSEQGIEALVRPNAP
jgi:outer membrane protein TolC